MPIIFKIALQRLWHLNVRIAEAYLKKWISWASRSRMHDIIKLEKTLKRHLNGILEAIKSGINSAVVEGLNNKIRTAFKRSYGFKAQEYRDTIIYLVAGGLRFPHRMLKRFISCNFFIALLLHYDTAVHSIQYFLKIVIDVSFQYYF